MEGNVIPFREGTTIIIKASGDLFVQGENGMEVRFQGSEDRIRVNQSNNTFYIDTNASLDLVVPRSAPVIVEKTGGSAFLQDLDLSAVIQKVGGDLVMRRIGMLRVDKVGGSCWVDDVKQPSAIQRIGGDLALYHVVAPVQVEHIGGSGDILVTGGGLVEARAGGDLRLYMNAIEGHLSLLAGACVELHLPPSVNADLSLDSGAESIDVDLNNQHEVIHQSIEESRYEFRIGEGGTPIMVRAGGDILVSDEEAEPRVISEEIDSRENAWKEAREQWNNFPWEGGFGFSRNSAWAEMVSRRAQEATERAERRANAAMRRTEERIRQAAERGMRQADMQFAMGGPTPPPPPPPPPAPKVTEQERLMVLEMLKENKITVEQAEKLLAALEGRFEK